MATLNMVEYRDASPAVREVYDIELDQVFHDGGRDS